MAKFLQRLLAVVRGKELAGKDNVGNAFYRHSTTIDGAVTEKRWVEYVGDPNPTNLPAEWYSWLIGRRKEAPTLEESMALEAYRKRVKKNAAMVEKEEEKRRFRQKSLQQDATLDTMKPPEMNKFIQQVATLEGLSFDGEDKDSLKKSGEETSLIGETSRGTDDNMQGSGKGGQDGHESQTRSRKERGDVYEKWVPPS